MGRKKGKRYANNEDNSNNMNNENLNDQVYIDYEDDLENFENIDNADFEKEYRKRYKNEFLNKYIDDYEDESYNDYIFDDDNQDYDRPKTSKKKKLKTGEKPKKKKKKRHFFRFFILFILLILVLGVAYFVYKTYKNGGGVSRALQTVLGHNEDTKKDLDTLNVLLLGVSTDLDSTLTDTIMIASYNPNLQKATLFSIQRDTFVGTSRANATSGDKINAVYSYKGAEGTLKAVNDITGLDIKYYAVVKTEGLIDLINEIGGVTFNVPINMKYDDPTQNLHINLKKGEQVLDGDKAEQLLRFRHNNDGSSYPIEYGDQDIGRMRTQRDFITETIRQTCTIGNLFKLNKILDVAKKNIETNLDFDSLKDYIPYAIEFDTSNLQSASLPGQSEFFANLWFYVYNKKQTAELINQLFISRDLTQEKIEEITELTGKAPTIIETTNNDPSKIIIKLQNGTTSTTITNEIKSQLEAKGYTVQIDSKETTTGTTTISNRNFVDDTLLDDIKQSLGTGIISNNSSNSETIDIVIVLGEDILKGR